MFRLSSCRTACAAFWASPDARSAVLLLLVTLALWAPRMEGCLDLRFDAGAYYITATALAQGQGYRLLCEPGEIEAVQYPPLLPAVVAMHQWAAGSSDPEVVGPWLRGTYLATYGAYLLAVYALARHFLRPGYAFAAALIVALNFHTVYLSNLLFTEVPFTLLTVLFFLCQRRSEQPRYSALSGLLAAAAFLMRSAGVTLLAAWVGEALLARRWRTFLLRSAMAAVPFCLWQGYLAHVSAGREGVSPAYEYQYAPYMYRNVTYGTNLQLIDPFRPDQGTITPALLAARVMQNLPFTPGVFGQAVSIEIDTLDRLIHNAQHRVDWQPINARVAAWLLLSVIGLLLLASCALLWQRGERLLGIYLLLTTLMIFTTPWPVQFPRYFAPLAPFLAVTLLVGLEHFKKLIERRWGGSVGRRLAVIGVAFVLVSILALQAAALRHVYRNLLYAGAMYVPGEGRVGTKLFYYDEHWATFDEGLAWIDQHAAPDEIIATSLPHWAYLKTGHQTVLTPMEADRQTQLRYLDSVPVRWVIIDQLNVLDIARHYTQPALLASPEQWELVHTVPQSEVQVFRRVGHSP